ncbi:formate dehydrogenase accessory protein FdhE [Acerihabitans arboris]|uniref:Protein FdhE homolog n=1 Tax=Acerihabitans arboris TaxID=2691583 RepID=A0A845SEL2_9GAMM|nr:formate dehydrogenase accessory protein FdhE [Acerihabitans arboris]NDL61807.1 formate dehydrogenase accessory protein FdhE [Acerihabitans arboris]
MAIHIVAEQDLTERQVSSSTAIPPLLIADLPRLYQQRADRLLRLSADHPFGDYLRFAAGVVQAQRRVLEALPLDAGAPLPAPDNGAPPLDAAVFPRSPRWRDMLRALILQLLPAAAPTVRRALETLSSLPDSVADAEAQALLNGDFARADSARAPFLWAALSLYWAQLAGRIQGHALADGGRRQYCPVCGGAPVASVIQAKGAVPGLRYLHCALCESEWHLVRAVCSSCEQTDDLVYWSLDDRRAAVTAESCGHCHSYLKVVRQDKDAAAESVADDLASIMLDAKLEEKGFSRSGINPFLFPAG